MAKRATKPKAVPRVLSRKTMQALLEEHGWTRTIGGKHSVKMEKPGQRPITLPQHSGDDYGKDLRSRILRQAGLS
jgi:predicted RNA binding protein YcfA (HicA-like mRNA interferase family)